ncbi:unnamed protein product, partial [Rotaria sp. Silwood2]
DENVLDYAPNVLDFNRVTINPDIQDSAEALAGNSHEIWAK